MVTILDLIIMEMTMDIVMVKDTVINTITAMQMGRTMITLTITVMGIVMDTITIMATIIVTGTMMKTTK